MPPQGSQPGSGYWVSRPGSLRGVWGKRQYSKLIHSGSVSKRTHGRSTGAAYSALASTPPVSCPWLSTGPWPLVQSPQPCSDLHPGGTAQAKHWELPQTKRVAIQAFMCQLENWTTSAWHQPLPTSAWAAGRQQPDSGARPPGVELKLCHCAAESCPGTVPWFPARNPVRTHGLYWDPG